MALKYLLEVENESIGDGLTQVMVSHEPTDSIASALCTEEEREELTQCLLQEVTDMVDECENWLH